jgi:hypothetical protein
MTEWVVFWLGFAIVQTIVILVVLAFLPANRLDKTNLEGTRSFFNEEYEEVVSFNGILYKKDPEGYWRQEH